MLLCPLIKLLIVFVSKKTLFAFVKEKRLQTLKKINIAIPFDSFILKNKKGQKVRRVEHKYY